MASHTLLVLSDPADRYVALLDKLSPDVRVVAGRQPEIFDGAVAEADAILIWGGSRELLEHVWARAPRVRWIHSRSTGLEYVLFPELVESDVPVTNSRGVFSRSLAEFVIAGALFFAKDFRRMMRSQAAAVWEPFDVSELHGKTLGVVGYGDIGRASARLARAFGMRVIALRRRPELCRDDPYVDRAVPVDACRELMAESDYVAVAAPLTPATRGLVGEAEIAAMKPTAVLINVGRGPVVDEAALVRALEEKRIRGAALDVFDTEPLPADHPFYRLENVLLSPHCADNTDTWLYEAMDFFLANFERFRKGEPLQNVVDKRYGY